MTAEAKKIILRLHLKHKTKLPLVLSSWQNTAPLIKLISTKKPVTPIDPKNYHNKIDKIYKLTQFKSRQTEI